VIVRHHLVEAERIEQLALIPIEPPHHRQSPRCRVASRGESRFAASSNRLLQQNRHSFPVVLLCSKSGKNWGMADAVPALNAHASLLKLPPPQKLFFWPRPRRRVCALLSR
jgi:hypothetical protein